MGNRAERGIPPLRLSPRQGMPCGIALTERSAGHLMPGIACSATSWILGIEDFRHRSASLSMPERGRVSTSFPSKFTLRSPLLRQGHPIAGQ